MTNIGGGSAPPACPPLVMPLVKMLLNKKSKAMSLIYLFLYWHVAGIGIPDRGGSWGGAEAYQIREVEEAINLPGYEKLLNFRQLG